ncbi:MAG: hypothetical protein EBZ48_02035 [Proteobacteria bacterium]|nr:hypothetical protein [Pseudomonadota bacterium]
MGDFMPKGCPKLIALSVGALLCGLPLTAGATSRALVRKVDGGFCVAPNAKSKFVPASKKGARYTAIPKRSAKYRSLRPKCAALITANKLKLGNLASLSEVVRGGVSASRLNIQAVSGTPPTLNELGSADATEIYFVPGVTSRLIDGNPTESDCSQIFSSSVDGQSGGMAACRAAQNVGEAMGNALQSETTLCYMKGFPRAAAVNQGVASVASGALPSGGWAALFDTPETRDRVIKISLPSEGGNTEIYFRVKSAGSNLTAGYQYRAEFYACEEGANPQEAQTISIRSDNTYAIESVGSSGGGIFRSAVSGRVRAEASRIVFDTSSTRTAETSFIEAENRNAFKSEVQIGEGRITNKHYAIHGSEQNKGFALSGYSGDSMATLRFTQGAFKEEFSRESESFAFSGAVEYRDTGYRAAPESELLSGMPGALDDAFYQNPPTEPTLSTFNCNNVRADVSIVLNLQSPQMQQIAQSCEGNRFESRGFCATDGMNAVNNAYFNHCIVGPG